MLLPGGCPCSLTSCFKELPTCKSEPQPPPLLRAPVHPTLDGALAHFSHTSATSFHDLEHEAVLLILSYLPARDLASAAATCRHLRAVCTTTIPGMRLTLFPHQRAALRWMQVKEQYGRSAPHPYITQVTAVAEGIPAVYANMVSSTQKHGSQGGVFLALIICNSLKLQWNTNCTHTLSTRHCPYPPVP